MSAMEIPLERATCIQSFTRPHARTRGYWRSAVDSFERAPTVAVALRLQLSLAA